MSRTVKTLRVSLRTKSQADADEIETALLDHLDSNQGLCCVVCGNDWPHHYAKKVNLSVRLDTEACNFVRKYELSNRAISAIIDKLYGRCPLCGRREKK